jgi:hypothetical protein
MLLFLAAATSGGATLAMSVSGRYRILRCSCVLLTGLTTYMASITTILIVSPLGYRAAAMLGHPMHRALFFEVRQGLRPTRSTGTGYDAHGLAGNGGPGG